jgi:phage gp46-like protein
VLVSLSYKLVVMKRERKLQTIELVDCPDLKAQQVLQLVSRCGAVRSIVVRHCAGVSDKDCMAAERAGDGRCAVVYEA